MSTADEVLSLGSRLELFVDAYLIETMAGVTRRLHSPQPQEVVLEFNQPWEGACTTGLTVFRDGDLFRMYYRGLPYDEQRQAVGAAVACHAQSEDGIHWPRPPLGRYEHLGSRENNIVWPPDARGISNNFAVFRDPNPDCLPEERYKAVGGHSAMHPLVSADGLHWRLAQEDPLFDYGPFDSQNLVFYDSERNEYRAYIRDFLYEQEPVVGEPCRTVRTAVSPDFLRGWTQAVRCGYGDTPAEQLYAVLPVPYFRAPHIYLALAKRFHPQRHKNPEHPHPGLSDGVLLSSRDGLSFDRSFMEAWIRPGPDPQNWVQRTNMPAWGLLHTGPTELSVYWIERYYQPDCRLRRGTLRLDGFASVNAGYRGGEFTTRPLTFEGNELLLNYATSAVGSIRVEVQNVEGAPLEGYALEQCPEIYGDEIAKAVSWEGGRDLSALAGRAVRLRFVLRDADLYALRFRVSPTDASSSSADRH